MKKKLADQVLDSYEDVDLCEMGRTRSEAERIFGGASYTIQQHLWKVFAYSKHRPKDVSNWLTSLNKHLKKLRAFNTPKRKKGFNFNREQLRDRFFTDAMFGNPQDIEVLIGNWSSEGFPKVSVSGKDRKRLMTLADKYVDFILSKSDKKFTVTDDELL